MWRCGAIVSHLLWETFGFNAWSWMFHQQTVQTCQSSTDGGGPHPMPCLTLEAMVPLRFQWCALEPTSIVVMWLPLVKRFQRCLGTSFTGCVRKGAVEGPSSGGNDRFYEPWNPREISQETLFSLKRSVWIKKGLPFASMLHVSIWTTLGGQCTDRGLEAGDVRGKVWLKNSQHLTSEHFWVMSYGRINL